MDKFPQHVTAISPLGDAIDGSVAPSRRGPRTQAALNSDVTTLKVDEITWALALAIRDADYDGDPRSIRILGPHQVEISNAHLYAKGAA